MIALGYEHGSVDRTGYLSPVGYEGVIALSVQGGTVSNVWGLAVIALPNWAYGESRDCVVMWINP